MLSGNLPVLFVAYDIEARGPISTMQPSRGVLAGALVLSAEPGARAVARLTLEVRDSAEVRHSSARPENAALVEGNAMADALPLFEALASGVESQVMQMLAPRLALVVRVTPAPACHSCSA